MIACSHSYKDDAMEQKRVLWIVAAVGLFLSVTIGTALIVYRPANNQTPVLNSQQLSSSTWTRENPAPAAAQPATPAAPAPAQPETPPAPAAATADTAPAQITNLTVISANTNVISDGTKTIDLNALTKSAQPESLPAETAPATAAPVQPVSAVASAEITVKTVTTPATTTTAAPEASATTATPAKSTKAASSSVKTTSATIPDQFWVQAASFTKKVNAEEARDALAAEKIPGEVFTWKDANGVVYYRLRVGPYTTKSEADYWLSRIKEIGAFSSTSSYVVNSSEKAVN